MAKALVNDSMSVLW